MFEAFLAAVAVVAGAQDVPASAVEVDLAPGAREVVVPKDTPVALIVDRALGSVESKPGDSFPLHLADAIMIDGIEVVPAGTPGSGEVVHAAKARWGGKPGELIVNARFLDCGPVRIKLGKMKLSEAGENNSAGALAATMVAFPAAFIISGGNVHVPAGTRAEAKIIQSAELISDGRSCRATSNPVSK